MTVEVIGVSTNTTKDLTNIGKPSYMYCIYYFILCDYVYLDDFTNTYDTSEMEEAHNNQSLDTNIFMKDVNT